MNILNENIMDRFLDILNYPLIHRCPELGLLIDRCSTKDLKDFFPILINSIFGVNGGPGWGFRTLAHHLNESEFNVLYNFFIPAGPIFRLLYKLLNDALKFEIPLFYLPIKIRQMLESGRYPIFYSDLLNIDPFSRQITSLALNSFDYFMFHFAIHGTLPFHKMYPAALSINNEKWKSVYLLLTADYVCSFMPSHPDAVVIPRNICGSVKSSPTISIQPIKQQRSPKYLTMSALTHHSANKSPTSSQAVFESPRISSWRTESVLHIFSDTWLRYDSNERDLPGNEFIRVLRIFVKQLHAFSNSVHLDNTPMSALRKIAQPMMNTKIYPLLRNLISRWPLDSSFSVVLELWLSYIQPWRYTFNRDIRSNEEIQIHQIYESFIAENLIAYTQIFNQLVLRLERLDLATYKNVLMLHRMLKVFNQPRLADLIKNSEFFMSTNNIMSSIHDSPMRRKNPTQSYSFNTSETEYYSFYKSDNSIHEENYGFMFSTERINEIEKLIKKMQLSKLIANDQLIVLDKEINEHYKGIMKYIRWFIPHDEDPILEIKLSETKRIPDILDLAIQTLSNMFQIEILDQPVLTTDINDINNTFDTFNYSTTNNSEFSDSLPISPSFMKKRIKDIKYTGDPILMPIQNNEFTFLVRFLHQVSCKLNIMFSGNIAEFWNRSDIWGRISRQILIPPMIIQEFDKSHNITELYEKQLGPRISLRRLASFKTSVIFWLSFIFGYICFGVPSYGLFILLVITFFYIFLLSIFWNVPISN